MIKIISAISKNGIIGDGNGNLPFDYPEDMKHFRKSTLNSVIIMGRKTFEGIGKPLPKRRNIVISRIAKGLGLLPKEGIEIASSLEGAIDMTKDASTDVWLIGGAFVYEEGMKYADELHLTLTPDNIVFRNPIKFPWINPQLFNLESITPLVPENKECKLMYAIYKKVNYERI
jgi:dihydrofolate reductase